MSRDRRRTARLTAAALVGVVLLAGCGDSEVVDAGASESSGPSGSSGSSAPSGSSGSGATTEQPAVIEVEIEGDQVTPNGDLVEVKVGQPVQLEVTADSAGEIHVHSDPEQELEYEAGQTTLQMAPIQRPGIVDVESHTLDKTIVQLLAQ